jgi:hypothetical protein
MGGTQSRPGHVAKRNLLPLPGNKLWSSNPAVGTVYWMNYSGLCQPVINEFLNYWVSQPANSSLLRIITTIATCSHVSEILHSCHPHARDRMCSGLQRPDSGHCSLLRLLLTLRPCPCLGWRHNSTSMAQNPALYVNDKTESRLDSFWGNSARS